MITTFVDSGILIEAYRSVGPLAAPVLALLTDPDRPFVTSDFVRLEVRSTPAFFGRATEVAFYRGLFRRRDTITKALVRRAQQRAESFGLSAVDALHVAAAEIAGADELVTIERRTSPLARVTSVRVVSMRP
jgi:predicted nucleic acid-binding protein